MGFVFEEITDLNKEIYPELNGKFPKEWCIDRERNIAIWGGLAAGHWMPISEGNYHWKFYLDINHELFEFILEPEEGSKNIKEKPYIIKWDKLISCDIDERSSLEKDEVIRYLKEALSAWGAGRLANKHIIEFVVKFNF
ncbi:hypothetical protein F975_02934 [Acinetobacter sp. ANC 3789]|uniref:hypothetical protein n=1 Tax=Acinetobacter sp. ANC 3789 TaxID=1217714 RepID=UPI0002D04627|nr:hypothetical protein [Acinetobacter sp. ANC 3789]ENU79242.1 hypothetical protein F975_02934 [Acinetobacter sp. ANC 3789]